MGTTAQLSENPRQGFEGIKTTMCPGLMGAKSNTAPGLRPRLRRKSVSARCQTGLDYFGARYFSSTLGRFTSPDPLMASGRPNNPQTWNRYTYTLNNPLRYIDPLGLYDSPAFDCEDDDPACLNDEQRRVQKKAGGKSFWSFLVPKQQNAFVNNTDALNSVPLSDGTSALNLVKDVNDVAKDRIYGNSDPSLMHEISNSSLFDKADSSLHGKYSVSFKSNEKFMKQGNLQISFTPDGTMFDADMDMFRNPFMHALGEVVPNHIMRGINRIFNTNLPDTTNQDAVRKMLILNPNIGITPSPDTKFNR